MLATGDKEINGRVIESIQSSSPILTQIYELLQIPEHLRFNSSDSILKSRNDVWNYHAPALINKTLSEIKERKEFLEMILFHIRLELEPIGQAIDRIKHEEREKNQLLGIEKSAKAYSKTSTSKASKLTKEEKEAKTLGLSIEQYRKMISEMEKDEAEKREKEFRKLIS
jgi:hypothetical protein